MTGNAENQLAGLNVLLQITRRVRESLTQESLAFIAVNESKQLLSYSQSALWLRGKGVFAVSGIPAPDRSSPYMQWLAECCKQIGSSPDQTRFSPSDSSGEVSLSWKHWAPTCLLAVPLKDNKAQSEPIGLLLFFRGEPWQEHEQALASELAAIYAHGFRAHSRIISFWRRLTANILSTVLKITMVLALLLSLFIPIRMSVQAPAEVVPKDPFVVRSPLDTVIDKFFVKPNQTVVQGDLLFEFERSNLGAKHGVASKAYQVAAEEYRQAAQTALVDDKLRADITPRRGRMEEKATELSFSRSLLNKTEVRAPRGGIVVFAEQSDWVGKNVAVGERVLTIADPKRVEILIRVPVADAIDFGVDNEVRLYLYSDPQNPLEGKLRYAAYKPEIAPSGIVAYRLKADFAGDIKPPRIGLTGTARIYGSKVSLGYYLFRRPLISARQWFGW